MCIRKVVIYVIIDKLIRQIVQIQIKSAQLVLRISCNRYVAVRSYVIFQTIAKQFHLSVFNFQL
jgi:hypothetical protein